MGGARKKVIGTVLALFFFSCGSGDGSDHAAPVRSQRASTPGPAQVQPAPAALNQTAQATTPSQPAPALQAPALPPVQPGLILSGHPATPQAAITFDACDKGNGADFDRKIWAVLLEKKVKATIFLGGRWMEQHPAETKMIGQNPLIEIGNHSYLHPDFRKLNDDQVRQELSRTQNIQWQLMGRQGIVFRFPYGFYDDRSLKIVAQLGLYAIQWNVVSGDPDPKIMAPPMVREVLRLTKSGSIIIFHINGRGWHTAEALPAIVDGLRKKGFELVTVSEMMGFSH